MDSNEKSTKEVVTYAKGIRVLVVDDNPTCIRILDKLLQLCTYTVTSTTEAVICLQMLKENGEQYDIVITDVHMPDMDGFTLLEKIIHEIDIPVIMLSGNENQQDVMRGINQGAADYLVKPARLEELRNIWQHVYRRKQLRKLKGKAVCVSESEEDSIIPVNVADEGIIPVGKADKGKIPVDIVDEGIIPIDISDEDVNTNPEETVTKKRKDQINSKGNVGDDSGVESSEGSEGKNEAKHLTSQKKARIVWSADLHKKFVASINQLGINKAFPKRILSLMSVEGLTRENVASHLQKYRLYLKRQNTTSTVPGGASSAAGVQNSSSSMTNTYSRLSSYAKSLTESTPTYQTTAVGLLGHMNTVQGYRIALSQEASNLSMPMSHFQTMGSIQHQNNTGTIICMPSSSLQSREGFRNQTSFMTVPTHVRPQTNAPRVMNYTGNMGSLQNGIAAQPSAQQTVINQSQFPSSSYNGSMENLQNGFAAQPSAQQTVINQSRFPSSSYTVSMDNLQNGIAAQPSAQQTVINQSQFPSSNYTGYMENLQNGIAAQPSAQQTVINQIKFPSSRYTVSDFAQIQHALECSFAADANIVLGGTNATIKRGQASLTAQNVVHNTVPPQTSLQNIVGSTNMSTAYNNTMVPVQAFVSSNQSFGQNTFVQCNNNVDRSIGQASNGGNSSYMQNAEDDDLDALLSLDENYFLEPGFLTTITEEDPEDVEDSVGGDPI